jgi:hypothetical protein
VLSSLCLCYLQLEYETLDKEEVGKVIVGDSLPPIATKLATATTAAAKKRPSAASATADSKRGKQAAGSEGSAVEERKSLLQSAWGAVFGSGDAQASSKAPPTRKRPEPWAAPAGDNGDHEDDRGALPAPPAAPVPSGSGKDGKGKWV